MIEQIQTNLESVQLDESNCIVIGSGILNALGIRPSQDIDAVVPQSTFDNLSTNSHFTLEQRRAQIEFEVLTTPIFEIGTSWTVIDRTWCFEDLLPYSITIQNVRYVTLPFLLAAKKSWVADGFVREKDIRDIKLIENYLNTHRE